MLKSKGEQALTKVLIVDDEPDICFLFGRILHKRNLKTGYANNLAEATSSINADPPFLIFLDNSLPDGQGVDFIPYLKKNYPSTRVIMVTANDSASDKKNAFLQGADDFLGKPLSIDQIYRTLDEIGLKRTV
jgi:two-component system, OmpR family, response regulator